MIPTIDNPAIPQQFTSSVHDAITFAEQARRGACGTLQDFLENGGREEAIDQAQADIYATTKLLLNLTGIPIYKHVIEWKFNDDEYEHEVWIDGEFQIAHRRLDVCEVKLNEWLEWDRRNIRKNLELHGIQPSLTSPAALAATYDDDDDPITDEEIEAEIGFALRGEKPPVKEPYVKNLWDKASAVFRIEMQAAGFANRETKEDRAARLRWPSYRCGRAISSTEEMSADELLNCAASLRTGEVAANWTNAQHVAA